MLCFKVRHRSEKPYCWGNISHPHSRPCRPMGIRHANQNQEDGQMKTAAFVFYYAYRCVLRLSLCIWQSIKFDVIPCDVVVFFCCGWKLTFHSHSYSQCLLASDEMLFWIKHFYILYLLHGYKKPMGNYITNNKVANA